MASYRELRPFFRRLVKGLGTRVFIRGQEQAGPPVPNLLDDLVLREEEFRPRGQGNRDRNVDEAILLLSGCQIPAEQVDVEGTYPTIGAPDDLETVLSNISGSITPGSGDAEFSRDGPYPTNTYLNTGGGTPSSDVGFEVTEATFLVGIAAQFADSVTATVFVENESFTVIASLSLVATDEGIDTSLAVAIPAGDELRVRVTSASILPSTNVTLTFGSP